MDFSDEAQTARRVAALMRKGVSLEDATTMDNAFMETVRRVGEAMGSVIDNLPPKVRGDAAFYALRGLLVNLDGLENIMVSTALEEALRAGIQVIVMGGEPECDCPTCVKARAANATSYRGHSLN